MSSAFESDWAPDETGETTLRSGPPATDDEASALRHLTEISRSLHSEPDLRRLLDAVLDRVVSLARAERAFLVLRRDRSRFSIAASRNLDRQPIPDASAKISRAIVVSTEKSGRPVLTTNASADPRFSGSDSVAHMRLRAVLCVPLAVRGRSLGVLYLDNRFDEGVFSHVRMEQIEAFGAQAAIAIEHATFQDRAKRHAVAMEKEIAERKRAEQRLETQHAITRLLGEAAEPREAVPEMVRLLAEGIGWDAGGAWEPAPGGGLRCTHVWTAPGVRLDAFAASLRDRVFPRGEGMPGRVWASRTPEWCEDVGQDPLHPKSGAAAAGLRAAVAIPVTVGGETVGVVAFLSRKPVPKDPDLLAMMTNVGAQFGQFVARKRQEKAKVELEAMFRQAQKMDAIGRLAGGVAHDFNNMLTVIQGYGQLAMGGIKPETPMHEYLHEIAEAARRSGELTRQLLVFSREQVQPARVLDPNEIVRGVQKMLRRLLGEDIELEVSLDEDPGRVRADPGQLEQVIVNLAVNARDAMPSGGRLLIQTRPMDLDEEFLRTRATECRPGRYVAIMVSDTGTGIAPDVLPHIFEPFFTTKDAGKGTGLGLATVYGIVMQGGGLVSVYSEPGRGATFKVFLPRVAPLEGDPTEGMEVPPPARGTETVLVVEDDPQLRQLTRKLLEHHGYRVLAAESADAALALAAGEAQAIDLLLTDIVMPRVNGVDLARRLQEKRPDMRVMFTSGYTGRSLEASGVLDHPDAFIEKPFTSDDLARQVRLVLERPVVKA